MRQLLSLALLLAASVAQAINASGGASGFSLNGPPLPTLNGGTGNNWSATALGSLPYFSGNGVLSPLAPGTAGFLLTMSGGLPTWVAAPSSTPTGPAGGDLTGTYPNPRVGFLEKVAISLPLGGAVGTLNGFFSNSHDVYSVAFDGTNMWSVDSSANPAVFTKWDPSGNPTNYTFGSSGGRAFGMAFDGTNMWSAAGTGTAGVYKITPSGTITKFTAGITTFADAVATDNSGNIWTIHGSGPDCTMSEISPSGVQISSVAVDAAGNQCFGIAYDGVNMWTTAELANKTYKVSPAMGVTTYTPTTGGAEAVVFDGTDLWITGSFGSSVVVISTATGATLHTFSVGSTPLGAVWDGGHFWTRENNSTNLYRVSKAGVINTYTTGNANTLTPTQVGAFDGIGNIWWSATGGINEVQTQAVSISPSVGMVLTATGPYAAVWQAPSGSGGPAGGDLTGTYPNPTVAAIGGVAVSTAAGGAVGTRVAFYSSTVGTDAIAFDGSNMWTANNQGSAGAFSKYTSTGAHTEYASGSGATQSDSIAFDGTNMWAGDRNRTDVYKITPAGVVTAFAVTNKSNAIAFDGSNMWTIDGVTSGQISQINPSGTDIHDYAVDTATNVLTGLAFDGVNMWTAANASSKIYRISPTGVVTPFSVAATQANAIAFDGTNLWVASTFTGQLLVVNPATGATLKTYAVGTNPQGLVWDGSHMWTHESSSNLLYRVSPAGVVNSYTTGSAFTDGLAQPFAASDGANLWVTAAVGGRGLVEVVAYQAFYPPAAGMVLEAVNGTTARWTPLSAPQVSTFTTGSGTYSTPVGAKYLVVELIAGGAGGQGGGGGNGSDGTNTTFGSMVAPLGKATAAVGSSPVGCDLGMRGNTGDPVQVGFAGLTPPGLPGAPGPLGGRAAGGTSGGGNGGNAYANSGGGGGGGGIFVAGHASGTNGGAGGYCRTNIASPATSYSYTVGAGGTGGTSASDGNGGNGAAGLIVVTAYFQ